MSQDESIRLLERYRAGDPEAATEIFSRYVNRLVALARSRMSPKLARRVDAEDVVQSVYRSFFERAREDRYELQRGGDLWRLLAGITVNKVLKKVEFHGAAKRDPKREDSVPDSSGMFTPAAEDLLRDPRPEEAVILADELEWLMSTLNSQKRTVLELRLQGREIEEIAEAVERSQRQVRRILDQIHKTLRDRWVLSSSGQLDGQD